MGASVCQGSDCHLVMGGCLSCHGQPRPDKLDIQSVADKRKVADAVSQPVVDLTRPDGGQNGLIGADSTVEVVQTPVVVNRHVTEASPKKFSPSTRQVTSRTCLEL